MENTKKYIRIPESGHIKNIVEILTACGCCPAVVLDENGAPIIKVNAPKLEG